MKKAIMNILCLMFGFSLCQAQVHQTTYPSYACNKYGTAVNARDLTNYRINGQKVSYRFRAQHTGSLTSIRMYAMSAEAGYGAGNYGTWLVSLVTDDGTSNHWPTGTTITSVTHSLHSYSTSDPSQIFPLLTFNSPARVDSGTIYHVTFYNTESDPVNNYSSVNTLTMWPQKAPSPDDQPFACNTDWRILYSTSSPYTTWNTAVINEGDTPIMEYYYSDGYSTGMSYMEVWQQVPQTIGGNSKVRETFTVSNGNRISTGASIWLEKVSGTGALSVTLETGSGTAIETQTIAASSISTSYSWNSINWSSNHTLTNGSSYHLVFTAPAGTSYQIYPIRKDIKSYGFTNNSHFSDGYAQYTTDGSTYAGWTQWGVCDRRDADLSFYFNVSANTPGTALPVQVTSFNGAAQGNTVALDWKTATEVNSYMFEIERRTATQWESIGKIPAGGTSNATLEYRYEDSLKNVGSGSIFYRLKLINNDGSFQYSDEVEVLVTTTAVTTTALPNIYSLSQNYPNPFNPTTTINYQLQKAGTVSLKVYDMLGREVATLVNGNKGPGYYSAIFDASRLSSGTYIYRLNTDSFTEVKKLVLLK